MKRSVRAERPDVNSEETYGEKAKKSNKSEQRFDYQNGSQPNLRAYDMVTGVGTTTGIMSQDFQNALPDSTRC